jgi:hypothetical protein
VVEIFFSLGIVAQTAVAGKHFSKVLCTVALHRKYAWALTF